MSQIKLMTFSRLKQKKKMEFQTDGIMTFYTRPPLTTQIQVIYIYIYTVFTIELVPNINKLGHGVHVGPQVKHVLPVVLQKWYV